MRLRRIIICFSSLGAYLPVNALVHEQVAFDDSDVCWWSLSPPDPICPILRQQNLTEIVNKLTGRYDWGGGAGDECEGDYCLYANRGFAGGRGIALITTHENYLKVKAAGDLLQEYDVSVNEDMDFLPFHVVRVDGKANGLIADSTLKRGDPIMAHTPVLLVHHAFRDDLPQSKQHTLLEAAIHALPAATRELLMAQLAHVPEQQRLTALLTTTNALQVHLDIGGDQDHDGRHYASFPEAARLNHDCRPNAVFYIDPTALMHITTAVTTIKPGQEITLSHLEDPFTPHKERQQQCAGVSEQEVADSETRLQEIRWIEAKLQDPGSAEASTGLITYLLGLYENERLFCCLAGAYALAAVNFNMLGYDRQAVLYAEQAIEALKIEKGEGVPEMKDLEALKWDPKAHSSWRARKIPR
ncbi:hypothetical protein M406DRAFT_276464 [Cryphonectria parasitica EP155]|uniref:SET domain-containing protein n=1 Tax=Cryphonectria parasitica (strain ATCC 38755 / EP155) TaxID=660469 RepID=A0A9P5CP42_CRYP1|nr:uncharacterized protein M406DRAFT_276464 [Cryphonectria parasitica EP155]KAF3765783.1 hypothetical protein M406DRAFT_276464 [Cryphonectria parasitica EP155]